MQLCFVHNPHLQKRVLQVEFNETELKEATCENVSLNCLLHIATFTWPTQHPKSVSESRNKTDSKPQDLGFWEILRSRNLKTFRIRIWAFVESDAEGAVWSLDPTSTLFRDHFRPWTSTVETLPSADSANSCAAWLGARENGTPPYGCTLRGSASLPMQHQKLSQKSATLFSVVLQDQTSLKLPMFHPPYFPGQSLHVCVPWNANYTDGRGTVWWSIARFAPISLSLHHQNVLCQGHLALEEENNSPPEDLWHDNLSQDLSILKGWELQAISPQSSIGCNPLVEQHLAHCFSVALAKFTSTTFSFSFRNSVMQPQEFAQSLSSCAPWRIDA